MADYTIVVKPTLGVIGLSRALKVRLVTRIAVGSEAIKGSCVTRTARNCAMCPHQLKCLVNVRGVFPCPGRGVMATFTIRRKPGARVARICGRGERFTVTSDAVHRCSRVFFSGVVPMTGLAISDGVNAGQSEPLLRVNFKEVLSPLPISFGVAVLTILTELPLMLVGVTVGAGGTHMSELGCLVATDTLCGGVGAGQMEARLVVIEIHGISEFRP